jgi:hypothetical protein
VAEGDGLLNADQHFGPSCFPPKSSRFNHFIDRACWLLLALKASFWELTGTILGTVVSGFPGTVLRRLFRPAIDVNLRVSL